MSMTDRELLELAAKAIGGTLSEGTARRRVGETWDKFEWIGPAGINTGMDWLPHPKVTIHPLEDDGDALRLAVKLGIFIGRGAARLEGLHHPDSEWITEVWKDDPMPATRRAIVLAAAQIGRDME